MAEDRAGRSPRSNSFWARSSSASWPLVGILLLALLIRLWGVTFGFPFIYHFDEPTYVRIALDLQRGVVGDQPNPAGYPNLLLGKYAVWFGLGALVGEQAAASWPAHPTHTLVLLGRLASAFLGTLTVALAYRLGKLLSGRTAGLLGAALLAVSFLHVRNSHYCVPDVAATFLVCGAVLLALQASQRASWQMLWASAAAAGLSVATKWTVAPVVAPVILAAVRVHQQCHIRQDRPRRPAFGLLTTLAMFVAGVIAGGFELLLEPKRYLDYLLLEFRAGASGGFWIWQVDTVSGWPFYLKALTYGCGIIPLGLAIVGAARRTLTAARARDWPSILVLSFVLPYYLAVGSTRHYFARYALPLIPFMTAFAAEAIRVLGARLGTRLRVARGLTAAALAVLAVAPPLAASARHGVLLSRLDTRTIAKEWIEAHIPSGAKFALDWPVYSPPLSRDRFKVSEQGQLGLAKRTLDWYREEGFDYLVTSNFVYDLLLNDPASTAARDAFYSSLGSELELVREFNPYADLGSHTIAFEDIYGPATDLWLRERPGPILRVYAVD